MLNQPSRLAIQRTSVAFLSALTMAGWWAGAAFAQQTPGSQPADIFQDQSQADPFSSRGSGQANSMLDLVNRVLLGPSKSAQEFNQDQKESLDDAAAQFRKQQQQRLQQNQPAGGTTTTAPATPAN